MSRFRFWLLGAREPRARSAHQVTREVRRLEAEMRRHGARLIHESGPAHRTPTPSALPHARTEEPERLDSKVGGAR